MLGDGDHAVVVLHGKVEGRAERGDHAVRRMHLERMLRIGGYLEPGLAVLQLQLAALCIDADMDFASG